MSNKCSRKNNNMYNGGNYTEENFAGRLQIFTYANINPRQDENFSAYLYTNLRRDTCWPSFL